MNLHVIREKRNPKMLHTVLPTGPVPHSEKVDHSVFSHRGKDRLAAALTQAPFSSSLATSADRGGKALRALWLTLSRNAMTCHLLVST